MMIISVIRHFLHLVIVVSVVMRVRTAHILWVCMVIITLLDDVVLFGPCHGEVLGLVLLVLIMICVVLVSMRILRGHMMMGWVHVVARVLLIRMPCVILVGGRVVTFFMHIPLLAVS